MTLAELYKALTRLTNGIDSQISAVETQSTKAQEKIYEALLKTVNNFELSDGRFVVNQDFSSRIQLLEKKIYAILGDIYTPSISSYLGHYATIEDTNIALQKSYNDLEIEKSLLTPSRLSIYNQAEYYLTKGLSDAYVQPVKYLLMQQITTGITIKDSERILKNWNEGNLTASQSELASGKATPNLQTYAGQIARDAAFVYNGTINEIIAEKHNLTKFIYTGGLVKDSRPFCRHLIGLHRKIDIDEIPELVKQYPQGLKDNTTKKTFYANRGGWNCLHCVMPVKG